MLDAIMAATEHLVVTYTGANETTGQPRPPAVPLGELLDTLDATAAGGRAHALGAATPPARSRTTPSGHPLQAFDRRNLGRRVPFSFDRARLAGALAAAARTGSRSGPRRRQLLPGPAGRRSSSSPRWSRSSSTRSRSSCGDRLEVALADEGEEVTDGLPGRARQPRSSGASATGCCATCSRGRTPRPGARARSGGAACSRPAGSAGVWPRSRRPGRARSPSWPRPSPRARTLRAVDVDVDLGDGSPAARHRHRPLRPPRRQGRPSPGSVPSTCSRRGSRCSRCAPTHPGRPWSAGAIGRGEKGRHGAADDPSRGRLRHASSARPTCCATWSRSTTPACASRCRCRSRPAHAWASSRQPGTATARRRKDGSSSGSAPLPRRERRRRRTSRVWGPDAPLGRLLGERPLPGEEYAGRHPARRAGLRLWAPTDAEAR